MFFEVILVQIRKTRYKVFIQGKNGNPGRGEEKNSNNNNI
jgi:hypothetical protein